MNIPSDRSNAHPLKCAKRECASTATGQGGGKGRYCLKHRAIIVMRTGCRLSEKHVPSFAQIDNIWPADNRCPRCKVIFEFVRKSGSEYGNHPSIQHFKPSDNEPNPLAVICGSCNHALVNLGDTVAAMSIPLGHRQCTRCETLKKHDEFYLMKVKKSGNTRLQSHCKTCQKARLRKHTDARRSALKAQVRVLETHGGAV